jgi:hypothetical protein
MGSLLATVLLAFPLIAMMSGTLLLSDSQLILAGSFKAPRGYFPNSRKYYSPAIALRLHLNRVARRWMR